MKQSRRRAFAWMLCILLLGSMLLCACTSDSGNSDTSAPEQNETSKPSAGQNYMDDNGQYSLEGVNMPAFNFTETEFRVCVYNREVQTTYFSEEIEPDLYDTTDDVLNQAVRQRNDRVFEETGVRVVAYAVNDVTQAVNESVHTGLNLYDAAMPFMGDCTRLAREGMLYDLRSFGNYIHLDAPWWDQSANESLSIADKLYFTTGDISIMQKVCSNAVAFNKKLYEDFCGDYGSLYQIVRDGKWTIDLMHEMGKRATVDSDGVPGMSQNDTWGLNGSNGSVIGFYLSAGENLIGKDNNDCPTLALGASERSVIYAQKLLDMLQSGNDWFFNVQSLTGQVDNVWKVSVDIFGENRALFYGCAFSAIKKLRAYSSLYDFGLIPMPKASEQQEEYCTPGGGYYSYGVCIPVDVPNPEFSAYMLEMLACYAKNTVTHAYYEVTLKYRDSKDDDSVEMLDQYIFNHIVYDLGVLYDFGGISSMFSDMMHNNSGDIVSELDSRRGAINAAIEECLISYELND